MTKILIDEATVKLALEALEQCASYNCELERKAITALKALAEQPAPVQYKSTGWAAHRDQYAVPVLFSPYTGEPRDVRDVQSDPQGILIVPPGKVEMRAAKQTHHTEQHLELVAEQPAQQEPFDSAPDRMKPFLAMHGIAPQEFNAFHVGFCCGEDFVKEQPAQQTCKCRWEDGVLVQQCTLHEAYVDAINEWAGRAKAAEAKLKEQPATSWLYWKIDNKCNCTGPFKTSSKDEAYGPDCIDQTPLTFAIPQPARCAPAEDGVCESLDCPNHKPAQQEPVAWLHPANATCVTTDPSAYARGIPLYTTPQPAQRKPLTDDQIRGLTPKPDGIAESDARRVEVSPGVMGTEYDEVDAWSMPLVMQIARAIEAAHGIKENT